MIKYLSLFSGIGAFEKALTNCNIPFELVNFSEIDKFAIKSYSLIHNVNPQKNLGDVRLIDTSKLPKEIDLITHGSPCQDFSLANSSSSGGNENANTRSSLMWESVRIISNIMPRYVIWENVKNVLSPQHKHNFDKYLNKLQNLGYKNYYKVLNAKDFGIPQNRQRIFVISILGEQKFEFPNSVGTINDIANFLENKNIDGYDVKSPLMLAKINNRLKVIKTHCWTITTKQNRIPNAGVIQKDEGYRFLTPLECFRLQGFDEKDYWICKNNKISNTQLYKQSGNSICVKVLEYIFKELFKEYMI